MSLCYCVTCSKTFLSQGIARHRAMHRDRKEKCIIRFDSTGKTFEYDYSKR